MLVRIENPVLFCPHFGNTFSLAVMLKNAVTKTNSNKMGLDISHIHLTSNPVNESDFLYIEDWKTECNVPLEIYSNYIQEIDDLDFSKSIIIIENEIDLEKLIKTDSFNPADYLKIFIGQSDDQMKKNIDSYIKKENFEELKLSKMSCEHDKLKYQIISFGEPIKSKGIYYIDNIGYQRKAMNNQYYELFKKFELRGKIEDFELAHSCIGGDWYIEHWGIKAIEELKRNFEKNFINKFQFGKSLLWNSF